MRQVGPFRLKHKLGQGGMSSVFLAEPIEGDGPPVALKLLNLSLETEPAFRKRFQREAELTQKLHHPHIVKTLSWADDPEAGVYLVMDYVSGGNFRYKLEKDGPFDLAQTLAWFRPIADALDYAHAEGVVHRDLKPENLLFDEAGNLRIADFGVARVAEGTRLTRTGVLPGTPEYMAPEMFVDASTGSVADVYSLATILYESLTGSTPFGSENLAQVLQRQAFEEPQPPSQRRPELPAYLDAVLLKGLAKKPEERYASAGELLTRLAEPPAPVVSSGSGITRRPPAGVVFDHPTRQVVWKQSEAARQAASGGPSPLWGLVWLVWTAALLAGVWRAYPAPVTPEWVRTAVGWQPAPAGRCLCASVLWDGIEIGLLPPDGHSKALPRARFTASVLSSWLSHGGLQPSELRGRTDGDSYVIEGPSELLRVEPPLAAALGASVNQVGSYWLALARDVAGLRLGQEPRYLEELERERPLRSNGTPPRYPLLDRLYEKARIRRSEGPLELPVVSEALQSLGWENHRDLREAARWVPLPKP